MISSAILILIVAKALPGLNTQFSSIHVTRISTLVFLFAGALSFNTLECIGSGIGLYSGFFQVTTISQAIEIFLFTIGGGILIANNDKHYSLVVLLSSLGSSLLISSYDLISLYLSIELQSFGLYILSTLFRDSESSTAAGLKYFLLGGLSSCIILLGTGIIYSYSGSTNLDVLYSLLSIQGLDLGFVLIYIGFLFKIAAAPLHNWSPDVYDGTPTIVTTWLTIIPKISILFILLELQVKLGNIMLVATQNSSILNNNIFKYLLLISATLSVIIGSLLGLAQVKIKRLLAYSTISHIGFILLALAVNTEQSIDSFIFYIIQYTITNFNIFLVILALSPDLMFIHEFKGLYFRNPLLSFSIAISLFSMAGIPPLIGFFSKQLVLYSALQNGYYFIPIVAIIVSVISCSYYLLIIKLIFQRKLTNNNDLILSNTHSYLISTLTFSILFFFIKPSLFLNSTKLLALSVF